MTAAPKPSFVDRVMQATDAAEIAQLRADLDAHNCAKGARLVAEITQIIRVLPVPELALLRAEIDARHATMAGGQAYTDGAGVGPGKGETVPLSQAVFDARAELTEQRNLLNKLNAAAAEAGLPTAAVSELPANAEVQAFPAEPPAVERAIDAFAEGTKDAATTVWDLTMPDVVNMYEVATDYDNATDAQKQQAAIDLAGMAPLPGAKWAAEGLEHGLDALGTAGRQIDDIPLSHADAAPAPYGGVDPPPAPHTGSPGDGLNHVDLDSGGKGAWNSDLNNPAPNTHYSVDDRFSYTTDGSGRVGRAEMTYDHGPTPADRNGYQQRIAGGEDRLPGDHGGHIFGSQFGGPGEAINLTAMRDSLNAVGTRDYYNLESQWRQFAEQGSQVRVNVDLTYPGGSMRPNSYTVETFVDGQLNSTHTFFN